MACAEIWDLLLNSSVTNRLLEGSEIPSPTLLPTPRSGNLLEVDLYQLEPRGSCLLPSAAVTSGSSQVWPEKPHLALGFVCL